MEEKSIENYLRKVILKNGGMIFKLSASLYRGIPDRLIILHGIHFVELKSSTGKLSKYQVHVHSRMKELGVPVYILNSKEAVDAWIIQISRESN